MTMKILAFLPSVECPACAGLVRGLGKPSFTLRYCEQHCAPTTTSDYVNVATQDRQDAIPHLHVTCDVCDFSFLMQPSSPVKCAEMRR